MLDFDKPTTPTQWIIFLAAISVTLSSPVGTRAFLRELKKYIADEQRKNSGVRYKSVQLSQALYGLKRRKVIRVVEKNCEVIIKLTESGRKRKLEYDISHLKPPMQSKWDGRWRMVMFDVPEEKRVERDALRRRLEQLRFVQFQKSVWIYPYQCEDEIDFITEFFSIGRYVNLITVKIEEDKPLRARFNL